MSAEEDDASAESMARKLIQAARSGCRESLNELLGHCRPYVWRIAQKTLGTELRRMTSPSTIAQDCLTRAFRSFAKFRGTTEQELRAWLRVQCNRAISDTARNLKGTRRKKKSPAVISLDANPGVTDQLRQELDESPVSVAAQKETGQLVMDAMAELPEEYRQVIKLRQLEELPNREVAARFGITESAAQARYTRAIRRLRDILKVDPRL